MKQRNLSINVVNGSRPLKIKVVDLTHIKHLRSASCPMKNIVYTLTLLS